MQLKITVHEGTDIPAKLLQDLYVRIKVGKSKEKTSQKHGKNPSWEETFVMESGNDKTVEFEVLDKDLIFDDHLGKGEVDISKMTNGVIKENIRLRRHLIHRGHLSVTIQAA